MLPDSVDTVIVTSDKDYVQLMQYDNVRLFDPVKREFIEEEDPKRQLDIKILTGDKSDNIPNVKPLVGEKTAMKVLDDEEKFEALLNETYVVPFHLKPENKKCKHEWESEDGSDLVECEKCLTRGKVAPMMSVS